MAIERLTAYTPPVAPVAAVSASAGTVTESTPRPAPSNGTTTSESKSTTVGEQPPTPRFPWLSFLSSRLAAEASIKTHQFESPELGDNVNQFA